MKKAAHYITKTKKETMPSRIVFFDCESRVPDTQADYKEIIAAGGSVDIIHDPYLIVGDFCDYQAGDIKTRVFFGELFIDRFWYHVSKFAKKKSVLYMMAHNA